MVNFNDIIEGFMKAQIESQRRGDFTPQPGIDYLNAVNDGLSMALETGMKAQNEAVARALDGEGEKND